MWIAHFTEHKNKSEWIIKNFWKAETHTKNETRRKKEKFLQYENSHNRNVQLPFKYATLNMHKDAVCLQTEFICMYTYINFISVCMYIYNFL